MEDTCETTKLDDVCLVCPLMICHLWFSPSLGIPFLSVLVRRLSHCVAMLTTDGDDTLSLRWWLRKSKALSTTREVGEKALHTRRSRLQPVMISHCNAWWIYKERGVRVAQSQTMCTREYQGCVYLYQWKPLKGCESVVWIVAYISRLVSTGPHGLQPRSMFR